MMGTGNAVRWIDNQTLSDNMNAVVEGIKECQEFNGCIFFFLSSSFFFFLLFRLLFRMHSAPTLSARSD